MAGRPGGRGERAPPANSRAPPPPCDRLPLASAGASSSLTRSLRRRARARPAAAPPLRVRAWSACRYSTWRLLSADGATHFHEAEARRHAKRRDAGGNGALEGETDLGTGPEPPRRSGDRRVGRARTSSKRVSTALALGERDGVTALLRGGLLDPHARRLRDGRFSQRLRRGRCRRARARRGLDSLLRQRRVRRRRCCDLHRRGDSCEVSDGKAALAREAQRTPRESAAKDGCRGGGGRRSVAAQGYDKRGRRPFPLTSSAFGKSAATENDVAPPNGAPQRLCCGPRCALAGISQTSQGAAAQLARGARWDRGAT